MINPNRNKCLVRSKIWHNNGYADLYLEISEQKYSIEDTRYTDSFPVKIHWSAYKHDNNLDWSEWYLSDFNVVTSNFYDVKEALAVATKINNKLDKIEYSQAKNPRSVAKALFDSPIFVEVLQDPRNGYYVLPGNLENENYDNWCAYDVDDKFLTNVIALDETHARALITAKLYLENQEKFQRWVANNVYVRMNNYNEKTLGWNLTFLEKLEVLNIKESQNV